MEIENNALSMSDIFNVNAPSDNVSDPKEKAQKVAANFAAIFVNEMLQSSRKASLSEEDSLFNSDQTKMSQKLYYQQIATDLSHNASFGVTNLIAQQLEKSK